MPTFAAAIPPKLAARQGSPCVFAAAEASFPHSLNIKKNISTFMPLFTPYFSLDSSAFRVGNGGRLRCRMGASGIGIYVMLLSHLRDCRDCRAPLDYDMLAFDLHEDAAAVRRVVEDFGLFDIDRSSGTFTSAVLTTVRGMLSDDGAAAVGGTTRTVRQRRVRSAGETYRRAVRRLAEDNALPPAEEEAPAEGDAEPAEEAPTSSENEITPAEGEHPFAEEANACACRAFDHDVDHHGHARAFDGFLGRGLGCDASGHACACASLDGHARGYACACRAFAHDVDHHGYARAFDGNAGCRGSLTLAHGATPCRRPLRRTAFRLAPHPAERDSAGAWLIQ